MAVEGKSGAVGVNLFQGDSRKAAYDIISGRWFTAPGEVVAPSRFLASTGTRVGDSIVLVDQGERVRVRIVGEDFDPTGSGMQLAADVRTIPRELASGTVEFVHADPRVGVTVDAYLKQLNGSLQQIGAGAAVNSAGPGGSMVVVIEAMSLLLTLMLLATAGLGILNSVVLDTRERVRDLGICRALGMTPGQTTAQVLVTVAGLGLAGGLAGAPSASLCTTRSCRWSCTPWAATRPGVCRTCSAGWKWSGSWWGLPAGDGQRNAPRELGGAGEDGGDSADRVR
ncbi:FtsX-like permease family protein [Streptacidiphilus monticola]